jgi:hypothetical protein
MITAISRERLKIPSGSTKKPGPTGAGHLRRERLFLVFGGKRGAAMRFLENADEIGRERLVRHRPARSPQHPPNDCGTQQNHERGTRDQYTASRLPPWRLSRHKPELLRMLRCDFQQG